MSIKVTRSSIFNLFSGAQITQNQTPEPNTEKLSLLYTGEDYDDSVPSSLSFSGHLKWRCLSFVVVGSLWTIFTILVTVGVDPWGLETNNGPKLSRPLLYVNAKGLPTHNINNYNSNTNKWVSSDDNTNIDASQVKRLTVSKNSSPKIILFYSTYYKNPNWITLLHPNSSELGQASFPCPRQCLYTHDRQYMDRADVVIFSIADLMYSKVDEEHIEQRSPRQIWAGFICESPVNVNVHEALSQHPLLDSSFNWTLSYRRDSEIYWPSGHFYKRRNISAQKLRTQKMGLNLKPRKLISWLVSNCYTKSHRRAIVDTISEYVPVDVYGACGSLKCPKNYNGSCKAFLGENYKFYLAFENSLCHDYVTEKFFEPFSYNMVPIVYGLGNYEKLAPSHSYINMMDFKSVKALTDYLLYLDKNEEEYLKYFWWKEKYGMVQGATNAGICNVCVKTWKAHEENNVHYKSSFTEWWTHKPKYKEQKLGEGETIGRNRTNAFIVDTGRICSRPKY